MSETRRVYLSLFLGDTSAKAVHQFYGNRAAVLSHIQVDVLPGIAVSHLHAHGIEQVGAVQAQTGFILQKVPLGTHIDRKDRFRIADTGNHA